MTKMKVNLTVNGQAHEVEAEPRQLLIHLLREDLNLTGPHIGCETSHCGACTIEMDGKSVKACTVFAAQAQGADITTIEGLSEPGTLNVLQESFREHHGLQCGYCTPGMILAAEALLSVNADPTEHEVREAISGNICRCTGYVQIVDAILLAAKRLGQRNDAAPSDATLA